MQGQLNDLFGDERFSHRQPTGRRPGGPIRTVGAALFLLFSATLMRIAQVFTGLAHLCAGDATIRSWTRAVNYFRSLHPRQAQMPRWEQTVLRIGPSVLMSIGVALMSLFLLLVVGGATAWLVWHGYGFVLMIGAVFGGTCTGVRRARLSRHIPDNTERLN